MLSAPLIHGAYRGSPSYLPDYSLVCDFKRGLYRRGPGRGRMVTNYQEPPGASYVRAGADLIVQTPFGLSRFAANQPPVVPGYGLMSPDATTNFCSGHNFPDAASPIPGVPFNGATVTKVARADLPEDVLAALAAVDPQGIVTHVWRMICPEAPAGINIEGSTAGGPTNTFSAFTYVVSGNLQIGSSSNEGLQACGTGFTRSIAAGVAVAGTRTMRLRAATGSPSNAEIYWFGHQSEAKGFATAVAVVNGAAASRGQPVAELANLDAEFGDEFTLVVRGRFPAIQASNANSETLIWVAESDSTSQFNVRRAGSAGAVAVGLSTGANINLPIADPGNAPFAMALRVNRLTGHSRLVTNGQARADARAWPDPGKVYFGGNTSGSTVLRERVEFAGIIRRLVTDADLLALGTV